MLKRSITNLTLLWALAACGAGPSLPSAVDERNGGDQTVAATESVNPPIGYYEAAMAAEFDLVFGQAKIGDRPQTVYFNLTGGEVSKGFGAGQSFLVCTDSVSVPPAKLSAEDAEDVEFYVTNYFEQSFPGVTVTFTQPDAAPYTTVFVTTNYTVLGCGDGALKYHAPFDKENIAYGDVAFAFADKASNLDDLVTQVETAAERTLGVEGQSQLVASGITPQESLKGLDEIHSMSRLLWELQDKDVLDISPLHGELEATVPGGMKYLAGFDRIITVTVGVSSNQGGGSGGNGNGNGGGLVDWLGGLLGGGNGNGSGGAGAGDLISAVAILSGAPEIAAAAQILGPALGAAGGQGNGNGQGNGKGQGSGNEGPKVPRYDTVLGTAGYPTLAALQADLRGHAVFVSQEYEGQTLQSLQSLLVVAYAQAFRAHVQAGQGTGDNPSGTEQTLR